MPKLITAIRQGKTAEALKIIKDEPHLINQERESNSPALFWASWHGNIEVFENLIAAGADPRATDNKGLDWIDDFFLTSHSNPSYDFLAKIVVSNLMSSNIAWQLKIKNYLKTTGLFTKKQCDTLITATNLSEIKKACLYGNISKVKSLVSESKECRVMDSEGNSFLHIACSFKNIALVEVFLPLLNPLPNFSNNQGKTFLDLAKEGDVKDYIFWKKLTSYPQITEFISNSRTELENAIINEDYEKVKNLIANYVVPKRFVRESAAYLALVSGDAAIFKLVWNHYLRNHVNPRDDIFQEARQNGYSEDFCNSMLVFSTPLMQAIKSNDIQALEKLITSKESLLEHDSEGKIPLNQLFIESLNRPELFPYYLQATELVGEADQADLSNIVRKKLEGDKDINNPAIIHFYNKTHYGSILIASRSKLIEAIYSNEFTEGLQNEAPLCDLEGDNALHYAAKEGNLDICSKILAKFPELAGVKNKKQQTYLDILFSYYGWTKKEVCDYLLDHYYATPEFIKTSFELYAEDDNKFKKTLLLSCINNHFKNLSPEFLLKIFATKNSLTVPYQSIIDFYALLSFNTETLSNFSGWQRAPNLDVGPGADQSYLQSRRPRQDLFNEAFNQFQQHNYTKALALLREADSPQAYAAASRIILCIDKEALLESILELKKCFVHANKFDFPYLPFKNDYEQSNDPAVKKALADIYWMIGSQIEFYGAEYLNAAYDIYRSLNDQGNSAKCIQSLADKGAYLLSFDPAEFTDPDAKQMVGDALVNKGKLTHNKEYLEKAAKHDNVNALIALAEEALHNEPARCLELLDKSLELADQFNQINSIKTLLDSIFSWQIKKYQTRTNAMYVKYYKFYENLCITYLNSDENTRANILNALQEQIEQNGLLALLENLNHIQQAASARLGLEAFVDTPLREVLKGLRLLINDIHIANKDIKALRIIITNEKNDYELFLIDVLDEQANEKTWPTVFAKITKTHEALVDTTNVFVTKLKNLIISGNAYAAWELGRLYLIQATYHYNAILKQDSYAVLSYKDSALKAINCFKAAVFYNHNKMALSVDMAKQYLIMQEKMSNRNLAGRVYKENFDLGEENPIDYRMFVETELPEPVDTLTAEELEGQPHTVVELCNNEIVETSDLTEMVSTSLEKEEACLYPSLNEVPIINLYPVLQADEIINPSYPSINQPIELLPKIISEEKRQVTKIEEICHQFEIKEEKLQDNVSAIEELFDHEGENVVEDDMISPGCVRAEKQAVIVAEEAAAKELLKKNFWSTSVEDRKTPIVIPGKVKEEKENKKLVVL